MRLLLVMALLALATPVRAQEAGEVTPLFRDDAPLEITLSGPIRQIAARAEHSTEAYPALLQAGGATHAIELSARGISRRRSENCRFPPMRIDILANPPETSLFDHQGRIKLVTHCNEGSSFEQHLLREYAAYRLYNLVTPESFRVRLLRVTYLDGDEPMATKWGFFIEDAGDAARRLGRRELEVETIPESALDLRAAARFALFQYMIGNTDWDMAAGPEGTDCCHNVKLASPGRNVVADLVPLPYDLDNAGLVDPPYAVPHTILPIRSVTQRLYRGYCSLNPLVLEEAETFRQARPGMEAMLTSIPGLTEANRRIMRRYIDEFFADIATPRSIERKLLSRCR